VLAWGVKKSLISYVSAAPGGQLLTTRDVTWEDGAFRFPLSESSARDGDEYDFEGTIRFHGHFGMLVAELSALRIARAEGGWTLSFADGDGRVEGFTLDGEPARKEDSPERLDWENVRLTGVGSAIFGDHYPSGTLFDPLSVTF
jgi:hypothetical protein